MLLPSVDAVDMLNVNVCNMEYPFKVIFVRHQVPRTYFCTRNWGIHRIYWQTLN